MKEGYHLGSTLIILNIHIYNLSLASVVNDELQPRMG